MVDGWWLMMIEMSECWVRQINPDPRRPQIATTSVKIDVRTTSADICRSHDVMMISLKTSDVHMISETDVWRHWCSKNICFDVMNKFNANFGAAAGTITMDHHGKNSPSKMTFAASNETLQTMKRTREREEITVQTGRLIRGIMHWEACCYALSHVG